MRTAKRITTACLTAIMIFQALAPSTEVFAQELDAVMEASVSAARAAGNTARSVQDAVATALDNADQATSDDAATTPGADAGVTEGGNGSASTDGSQDSTTDGATSGDAPTEGDASQDGTTADDSAADEEQADDADADAAAQADVTYKYNTVEDLKTAIGESKVAAEGEKATKVTIETSEDLIKLSNANPAIYQDASITKGSGTGTGEFNLCGTATDGATLSFLGLGAPDVPFRGSFGLGTTSVNLNRPLFNNVELSADMALKLTWKGATSDPIVATTIAGGAHKLSVDLTVAPAADNTTAVTFTSPLLGSVSDVLTLDTAYAAKGNATPAVNIQSKTDSVGLLANTLADGATLSIENLTLPSAYSGNPTIQTTKDSASAGGLIGACGNGATVSINGNVDLPEFYVIGKAASGGLIGKVTNLTLNIIDGITIKPARNVGDENSACSGGVIGDVSFAQGFTVKPNMFDLGDGVTLGATQHAGALFGVADISNGDIVVQGGTYKSKLTSGKDDSKRRGSYGGLVGKVFATKEGEDGALRALVVNKDPDKNRCSIEFDLASQLYYAGGVVGYVGDSARLEPRSVAVVLNGVTVACKGDASARIYDGKLGGAVGVVDTDDVLDVRDFTLTSENPIGKAQSNRAAGIAGSAWNAVVKFSGITDLSGASFAENSTTGQLVYENNNALIFAIGNGSNGGLTDKGATGWTFKRSIKASKTDDIATYGEVIRLGSDFIKLDPDTHKLTSPTSLAATNGTYVLNTIEDFAKLAITWQTNGYYSMVNGVSDGNVNGLKSAKITVSGEIDLSGTGLTGLTQDRADGSQIFSGTLNGNGIIKLAVGEPYGVRDGKVLDSNNTSNGNGKIYRHGRLGLFAAVNGASISNVTIAGSMKFDNGSAIDAGSLAGTIAGNLTLSGATCGTNITCDDTFGNDVNIGGIAGSVSAAATVDFNNGTKAKTTIVTGKTLNGNTRIGGANGYVGDVASTFNVAGLEVGGSIGTGECASGKIAQVGGFIGCIAQSTYKNDGSIDSSAVKYVNISGLSFGPFKMVVGKNGDALKGAGGLLGYSWGNVNVTFGNASKSGSDGAYTLKVTGSSITAKDSTELGGLVYAASGHWILNDCAIDLSGLTINANAAKTLGVLVGRGCKVKNKTTYGVENYTGLYLEDKAYWETAYRVPSGENAIVAPGVTAFDEWVGSGVKPNKGSKLMDADWNTVVSLHTQKDKLDMDGDSTKDNSYKNRSSFGQSHMTNGNTRYFYNLDRAYATLRQDTFKNNEINTAEKLLLWSAYRYAPDSVRSLIVPENFNDNVTITGNINLDGYSYYPTQPNRNVTVKDAVITFCYSKIKAEQNGNKLNSDATQHENMHCGLFRTVANGDLTVYNVTLSGTVGPVVNDGKGSTDAVGARGSSSGALVCRYVYGSSNSKGTTIRNISINNLTLNNLIVDGAENATVTDAYMPLLINEMQSYVNLDAKNITATGYPNRVTAATSLFGRLGVDKNSNQVTAKFECISLPSYKDNTIFTHASLLESFGYGSTSTGSADYTFTKADADAGKVTYGSEIDAKDKEYSGKQLWYYDETTYGTDSGLVTVDKKPANAENPRFGDYLPYVYKGKATKDGVQYHEIKVNQRIPNLMTGCGTYGDPYTVKDATEMNAIANYINNGTALDGWEVTIAADQTILCERRSDKTKTDNEVVYVYKQSNPSESKWEKKIGETTDPKQTLKDETMRRYIQSAYYSIEPAEGNKITVDAASFGGFGNKANPFRGVIVGNLGTSTATATIEIENNKGELRGLIPYSYGSVVRNLNIRYKDAQATITYSAKDTDGVPTAFFGGVIGCILGGDNIIDGIVVNGTTANSPVAGFTVKGDGTKSHLVPIGGYVGAIAGGGVIFRHMSGTSWRAGTSDKSQGPGKGNFGLYDNPYVGRVIDGYAFSEDCDRAVDNGDANYKINQLDASKADCITTDAITGRYRGPGSNNKAAVTTKVNNAQGLLVLSAIISSGAAGGSANASTSAGSYGTPAGSRAYLGGNNAAGPYQFGNQQYGKVRNASYASVGKPESTNGDFETAINDDVKSPGIQTGGNALSYAGDGSNVNSPYLVKKYATWQTGYICAAQVSGMDLQFAANEKFNMTDYGSGFTGLSGRYYSNACASASGADRDRIVPLIACINGNGATIKVGSKNGNKVYGVTEYADDDYRVAGVGALFSTASFSSKNVSDNTTAGMVKDLKFVDCDVELTIKDTNGTGQAGDNVGVGLLAGVTANNDGGVSGIYRNVTMDGCKVAGAKNVGGLLGSSGYCSRSTATGSTSMVNENARAASPVKLNDCSYANMDVTGCLNVGGYVGMVSSPSGVWTSEAERVGEKTVGKSSTITATGTAPHVGGVFGFVKSSNISINTVIGKTDALPSSTAVVSGVNVLATTGSYNEKYMGAGGVVGRADGGVISISNVRICSSGGTESVTIGDGTGRNTQIRNAGGLIGEVTSSGSPNTYWFEDCSVKNVNVAGTNQCSGGLIGYYFSNVNITCNNIAIEDTTIKGSWSGGLLGAINKGSDVIKVANTKVSNTTFSGTSNGGIAGDGRGQFQLANVLMDSNTYRAGAKQGVLLGEVDTGDGNYSLSAAGVGVKPGNDKTTSDLPPMVYTTNKAVVNRKTYIAFGNYEDKLSDAKGVTLYGNDVATGNVTTAVSPYVTTSPMGGLSVRTSDDDATDRYLFGDGMNISLAETIKDEAGTPVANRYTYTNIGGIDDNGAYQNKSNYSGSSGTFNANNDMDDTKTNANPDVLVLSGNDSDTVKDYLNIVTNGGYSDALRLNADGSHVSATVDVFKLEDGVFVKQSNVTDKALDVKGSGSSLSISANTNWDNGKGRFNLLTVTFTEAGQSYRVMVPIIVKRVLEINFTATYSEGSNFNRADYSSKYDNHVLISSGETMTGHLTWTYNKAYKKKTEYGWNTHLASGGDMRPLNKHIEFGGANGALPAGTQLTLVDTAHNSKEYHYTVPVGGSCTSVALTDFEDSDKNHYTEQWLSETMGAKADKADDGAWVKLTKDEKDGKTEADLIGIAGAKIGNDYYRVKTDADTEGSFYKLTVPKEEPNEPSKSESFYLVVRTPKNSANVNGYTGTSVTTRVNTHLNYTLRKDETKDSHENTASTYSVATNFQHNLVDNKTLADNKTSIKQMTMSGTTYPLDMDVSDTITFGEQEYTSSDALYYQLDSSLVNCKDGNAAGAHGYPTGTLGTYSFYVKVGDNYYTWDGSKWNDAGAEGAPVVAAKNWSSTTGSDMSLVLADASGKPIDLSGIREIAKGHGKEFTITMKAKLTMTEPACQAGIIASQNSGNDKYTKPNYRACLSTHADTLSTSSNSAYNDGGAGYYRADVGSSTIALVASKKSQLGINIDDLKSADGEVALVGTYDFSKLSGADAMISSATTVTYTLSLQQRQDGGSYEAVDNISSYIAVLDSGKLANGFLSADGKSYVFTDSKGTDGTFATRDGNSLAFKHAFRVKVNTDVEGKGQTYANYRLVLTAHMSGGDVSDTPVNANNLDGYSNSDYVTYTLARINTEGIQHGSTTN